MLVNLIVESSRIWSMCILAILGGFCAGSTLTFFIYDRWAYKRFSKNEEQWRKLVTELKDIINLYQNEEDEKIANGRKGINIDVK